MLSSLTEPLMSVAMKTPRRPSTRWRSAKGSLAKYLGRREGAPLEKRTLKISIRLKFGQIKSFNGKCCIHFISTTCVLASLAIKEVKHGEVKGINSQNLQLSGGGTSKQEAGTSLRVYPGAGKHVEKRTLVGAGCSKHTTALWQISFCQDLVPNNKNHCFGSKHLSQASSGNNTAQRPPDVIGGKTDGRVRETATRSHYQDLVPAGHRASELSASSAIWMSSCLLLELPGQQLSWKMNI